MSSEGLRRAALVENTVTATAVMEQFFFCGLQSSAVSCFGIVVQGKDALVTVKNSQVNNGFDA